MLLKEIDKFEFAQINDKRYYFRNDIVSLHFSHPHLFEIIDYKEKKKQDLKLHVGR